MKECKKFYSLQLTGIFGYITIVIKYKKTRSTEPKKLNCLKSLKILPTPPLITRECATKPTEMTSLKNFKWRTRKERPNQSINNGDMECLSLTIYVVFFR